MSFHQPGKKKILSNFGIVDGVLPIQIPSQKDPAGSLRASYGIVAGQETITFPVENVIYGMSKHRHELKMGGGGGGGPGGGGGGEG